MTDPAGSLVYGPQYGCEIEFWQAADGILTGPRGNPVADACQAAGVPCISTVLPRQAWYFGRGAKEDDKAAFKFTYPFSFGV